VYRWQAELQDIEGDVAWYKGKQIEIRKRTKEGNHILRVGYVGSRKSREVAKEKLAASKQMQEGLWERQATIRELKLKLQEAEQKNAHQDTMKQLKTQLDKQVQMEPSEDIFPTVGGGCREGGVRTCVRHGDALVSRATSLSSPISRVLFRTW
jgi:hypothetical protein